MSVKAIPALTPYPGACHVLVVPGWRDLGFQTEWTIPYRQTWPWQARPSQGTASTGWTQPGTTNSGWPRMANQRAVTCEKAEDQKSCAPEATSCRKAFPALPSPRVGLDRNEILTHREVVFHGPSRMQHCQ